MLLDPHNPFFRPLWVRVLCTLVPLLWAGVEFWNGAHLWAAVFAAAGVYLLVMLFVIRKDQS